jgi:hypothetical protein
MRVKKVIAAALLLVVGMTALLERSAAAGAVACHPSNGPNITWNSDFTFCRLFYRQFAATAADGASIILALT